MSAPIAYDHGDSFATAGYGEREIPLGDHVGMLAIDFQLGFTSGELALGRSAHVRSAVRRARGLLNHARTSGLSIFHTFVRWREDGADLRLWPAKVPAIASFHEGSGWHSTDERVLADDDIRLHKRKPSAFFGTGLDAILRERGTDALSHGLRCVAAADACGDQDSSTRQATLADIGRRYTNVWPCEDVCKRVLSPLAITR